MGLVQVRFGTLAVLLPTGTACCRVCKLCHAEVCVSCLWADPLWPHHLLPTAASQECLADESPAVVAVALDCVALLCEADVLEFYAAWRVVYRSLPRLPEHPAAAAAWVRCGTVSSGAGAGGLTCFCGSGPLPV